MNVTRIRAPQIKLNIILKLASLILACLLNMTANAAIDVYDFDSPQQEAQYRGLIEEFRCPKCQNQNLAGSDAPIAQDLKQKTYNMVKDGRSDTEIRSYMQERYGDFISYKPPVRPSTWILWFFPPLLLVLLIVGWFWRSKRATRSPSAVFQTSCSFRKKPCGTFGHRCNGAHLKRNTSAKSRRKAYLWIINCPACSTPSGSWSTK